MTHGLILRVWQLAFQKVFHGSMTTSAAVAMCFVLIGVILGVSAVTYRFVEGPGRRAFNGLAMKWTQGARTRQAEI
jgi:peptidoglycan/LPS O-acetylase OafA/YrhL